MAGIKQNYLYNVLFTVSNIVFPLISFTYISRITGPEGLGKVQFILSFTQYFALFASLGIPIYGVREIAKQKHDRRQLSKIFFELNTIFFLTSLVFSLIYLTIIYSFSYFRTDILLYQFSALFIIFSFFSIDWFYFGMEQFQKITTRSIIVKTATLILLISVVKTKNDYSRFLYISVFSIIANNFFNFIAALNTVKFSTIKELSLGRHYKPMFFIFSTTLATSMYSMLDTVLLGFLSGDKAVGLYTASIKLCRITIPFIQSVGTVIIPVISKNIFEKQFEEASAKLKGSYEFIAFFSVPVFIGSFIYAPQIIDIISGPGFEGAIWPMRILSILPLLIGLANFLGFQVLIPYGKEKEILKCVSVGMVLSLILNFLIVPKYHETGEAIVNVSSEIIVTLSYLYYVRKNDFIKLNVRPYAEALISASPFFINSWIVAQSSLTGGYNLFICIIFSASTYFLIQAAIFKNKLIQQYYIFFIHKINQIAVRSH